MANILERHGIKMSDPVASTTGPKADEEGKLPPVGDARDAVIDFLKNMPDVRRVKVTKMAIMDSEKGIWEAEAEVQVPNETIKNLRLPTQREVLDCKVYLLRVDGELDVLAYGLKDSVEG